MKWESEAQILRIESPFRDGSTFFSIERENAKHDDTAISLARKLTQVAFSFCRTDRVKI
jgi:hypothetical protein